MRKSQATRKERLKHVRNLDGFKIAELDLELRGPEGCRHSTIGKPSTQYADLVRDRKIL